MAKIKSWLYGFLLAAVIACLGMVMLGSIILGMILWVSAFGLFMLLCWLVERTPE